MQPEGKSISILPAARSVEGRNLSRLAGFERAEDRNHRDLAVANGASDINEVVGGVVEIEIRVFRAKRSKVPIGLRSRRSPNRLPPFDQTKATLPNHHPL
jgi:hypothetical protein